MRLREFHAEAFGPFTNLSLDFSSKPHGLHFFYGPNEAGKSSLQRAFENFFYGIPHRSSDDFLHSKTKLRLRAVLEDAKGRDFEWTRRKGVKHTLLDKEGAGVDEEALGVLLGHLSQNQFSLMFSLNRARLKQGGMEMMTGGGTLGPSLFQAGTGRTGLERLLEGFEAQAGEIYRDRGEVYPLNKALKALEEAKKEARTFALSTDTWLEKQNELQQAQERSALIKSNRRRVEKKWRHLQRLKQARPLFLEIERLEKLAPEGMSLESLALVRELRQREAIGLAREKDWKQRQARWQQQYQLCQEQKAGLTEIPDLDHLRAVLSDAGEIRDLERRIQEAQEDRKTRERELECRFKRLIPEQVSVEHLSQQSLPPQASLQTLEQEAQDIQALALDLQRERERLERRLSEWEKGARREESLGAVPCEEDLISSRKHRQGCWESLYQEGIIQQASPERREKLVEQYLQSVQTSDDLSDVMRVEADRVAAHGQRVREKIDLESERADLQQREGGVTRRLAQWEQSWRRLWTPITSEPGPPKQMTAFFNEVQWIQEEWLRLQKNLAQVDVWRERLSLLGRPLGKALRTLNLMQNEEDLSLTSQITLGEDFLSDADKKSRQQQKIYQTLVALKNQESELLLEQEELEKEKKSWDQLREDLPKGDLQVLETQLSYLDQLEGLKARLSEISGEMDSGRLREEAVAFEEEHFLEVEEELEQLSDCLTQVDQQVGTLEAELKAMQADAEEGRAAQAAQEEALQAERVRHLSSRYAVLKTASLLLQRAMERYRERHEGPLLRRASEVFSKITCGSFSGLRSSFDDQDRAVLLGVRPSGTELGVDQMSDGTAEQLFLALRIASMESYVDQYQAMPIFLDDTLLDSDQERCEQILLVLNALASKTQVFLFSHHRYLLEIAREASLTELVEYPLN